MDVELDTESQFFSETQWKSASTLYRSRFSSHSPSGKERKIPPLPPSPSGWTSYIYKRSPCIHAPSPSNSVAMPTRYDVIWRVFVKSDLHKRIWLLSRTSLNWLECSFEPKLKSCPLKVILIMPLLFVVRTVTEYKHRRAYSTGYDTFLSCCRGWRKRGSTCPIGLRSF